MPKAIQLQWIQSVGTHLVPGSPGACRAPTSTGGLVVIDAPLWLRSPPIRVEMATLRTATPQHD